VTVGNKVRRFQEGDRVYAFGFANPKAVSTRVSVVKEDNFSRILRVSTRKRRAALGCDDRAPRLGRYLRLQQGESLLIFGASGGIDTGHSTGQRMGGPRARSGFGPGRRRLASVWGPISWGCHKDECGGGRRTSRLKGIDAALLTVGRRRGRQGLTALRQGGRVAYPNGVEPVPGPVPA